MPICHRVVTKATEHVTSCEWVIPEASLRCQTTGRFIETPNFDIPGVQNGEWSILLYPNGYNASSRGYLSIYVKYKVPIDLYGKITFKFTTSKRKIPSKSLLFSPSHSYFGYSRVMSRSDLFNPQQYHLKFKQLKLECTFEYSVPSKTVVDVPKLSPDQCLDKALLNSGEQLTDCAFIVEGKEIKAHKLILYLRSPVFQRMFETPMMEGRESQVIITDFSYQIVRKAIGFCYTCQVVSWQLYSKELLRFADKYDIASLKTYLEALLISVISPSNVCELYLQAELTNAHQLKQECTKFMVNNLDIISTFANLSSLNSDFIKELILKGQY